MAIPTITTVNPSAAAPGDKVIITGTNFTGITSIKFGGFDALHFETQSPTVIWAWVPIAGDTIVQVTNGSGTGSFVDFHKILTQVKLPDLTPLNRPIAADDLIYVWGMAEGKLFKALFPGAASGSDGGDTGNIYTALGSPFKVRKTDVDQYAYDPITNKVTITDVRLLGKEDYVVTATDVSTEFNDDRIDYDKVAGSFTISDYELTDGNHITVYADGVLTDAFTIYQQSLKDTITKLLLANAPFLPSLNSSGTMAAPGGLIAWFRPANEIPDGWTEWVPGRGCMLIGQDPTDIPGDGVINPLNGTNGTRGGSKTHIIDSMSKIIKHRFYTVANEDQNSNQFPNELGRQLSSIRAMIRSWTKGGGSGGESYVLYGGTFANGDWTDDNADPGYQPNISPTNWQGKNNPDPINHLNPYRIVNFICSTQTP